MKLNMNMKRHSVPHVMLVPMESSFVDFKSFIFSPKTIDYSPLCDFGCPEKAEKVIPLERASQGDQNGEHFSFVAPSSEEL